MPKNSAPRGALRIALTYAAAAWAYLLVSNFLLAALVPDPRRFKLFATLKGCGFVALTAALLYRTLREQFALRESATSALRELDRAQRMIGACDAAIIRARGREELFREVCRLAVEEGGYARARVDLDADGETGRERLFASSLSLPLRQEGRAIGALTLRSARPDAFDAAETALLETMAATISYALDNLARAEKERERLGVLRRFSHAVENGPATIVVTDAAGTIEFVNRKFTEVTGYAAEEVVGRNVRVLKSGETPPEEYRRLWETIAAGREWRGEFHNRKKSGELFRESASISPVLDEDGRITHYIAIKEDVTAERALEQQLRHVQKMEAVGTLAGGVAHDFNNILTVIQGHCALLAAGPGPDGARESVAEIQSATERAASLTRQLLAFGRKQVLNMRPLDLGEAAGRTCRVLKRLIPENVVLEPRLPSEPLWTRADPGMIEQALTNLIVNAREALPRGGRIVVEAAGAEDAVPPPGVETPPEGWARLRVTDDGCGIPPELLPRVFDPFVTTKAPRQGSGLGLATVDGIVRQHKGWATAESAVGKGSTFLLFLPRAPQEAPAEAAPPVEGARGGGERVLLVEDEPSLRRLAARALAELGYEVVEAADGLSALDAWRQGGGARLLISDMVMPGGMSGEELAWSLRAQDPDLRVLLVSGYHTAFADGGPAPAPGTAFLPKPFSPDELARAARAILDGA